MREKINNAYLKCKLNLMERMLKEEKGASDIVAIIVVIVIILAVAAIFREQLTAAVNSVFENLTEFIG